ncbi:MAG: proton-conducting transporter transmembrane domain-containing protein [Acidiferrobacter sp.]
MGNAVSLLPLGITAIAAILAFLCDALSMGPAAPWGGAAASLAAALVIATQRLPAGAFTVWTQSAVIIGLYLGLAGAAGLAFIAVHPLLRTRPGSFTGLVLTVLTGNLLLVSGQNLLALFVGLELQVLPFFALIAWPGTARVSLEAALKYAVLAAVASAQFALGIALIYLGTGRLQLSALAPIGGGPALIPLLGLLALIAALAFEIAAAPFHAWVADIYQGSPAPVLIFLTGFGKVAAMAALISLVRAAPSLQGDIAILAALSILVGNILAYRAGPIRRLFGYSSIAHAGYFLAALAAGAFGLLAATVYAVAYGILNVGTFMGLCILPEDTTTIPWSALRKQQPVMAGLLALTLLALAGMPPTIGFFAKLLALIADIHDHRLALALLLALGSAFSFVYYIAALWTPPATDALPPFIARRPWQSYAAFGVLLLAVGGLLALRLL